jgi:hypothetical protein
MQTNDLSSFKTRQVSHFPNLSHGQSSNTITNALTRALHDVYKRKHSALPTEALSVYPTQIIFLSFLGITYYSSFLFCPLLACLKEDSHPQCPVFEWAITFLALDSTVTVTCYMWIQMHSIKISERIVEHLPLLLGLSLLKNRHIGPPIK